MPQIVLENVRKAYGGEVALEEVSLSFQDDTTTAVVGPSGSGKSTLLQLINGLEKPNAGTVSVFDQHIDYEHLPRLRRRIGYAVQGTGLFPHMHVWDNITLLARLERWHADRIRERATTLMELVNLPLSFRTRYPYQLSGGEQQRVGLCRAMMLNPSIFLLDEPFGALDPITRSEIHEEFLHLQKSEARTIVMVTHDLREAIKLAPRLVILNQGRVVQHDLGANILKAPANDFVRQLFRTQLEDGRSED